MHPANAPMALGETRNYRPLEVFVADDDSEMLSVVCAALTHMGCHVTAVKDGSELLGALADAELARGAPPDLILTDVRMPGYTGDNILVALRNAGWNIPIVLMTAFYTDDLGERAGMQSGSILQKPIDLEELEAVVWGLARWGEKEPS